MHKKIDPALIFLVTAFAVSSGWFYVHFTGDGLSYNFTIRAICITLLLCVMVIRTLSSLKFDANLPKFEFIFIGYISYVVLISLLRGDLFQSISALSRLLVIYFVYIVAIKIDSQSLIRINKIFAVYFISEGLLSYFIFDAGLFLNGMWRLGGPIGSASGYAGLFFLINLWALMMLTIRQSIVFNSIVFVLSILLLYFTGSRSTIVFSIIIIACTLLSNGGIFRKIFIAFIFALLVYIVLEFLDQLTLFERVQGLASGEGDNSIGYRFFILITYFSNINLDQVLFGLGLNGFPSWFESVTGDSGVAPHIEYLTVLAEGGVVGVFIFIFGIASFFKKYRRRSFENRLSAAKLPALGIISAPLVSFVLLNPMYFLGVMLLWIIQVASILAMKGNLFNAQPSISSPLSRV